MSDSTEDAVIQHLRDRKASLEQIITDSRARLDEICGLLTTLADGRTRVGRRLKEVKLGVAFNVPGNGASEPAILPTDPPTAA